MKAVTIFGREPAAWVGLIEAALAMLVVFRLGVSVESSVLIMAVISALFGAYTAWATKDTMLGVVVGLVKATIGLGSYYGLGLDEAQIAGIVTFTAVAVGFYQRTQTQPVGDPLDPSPPQVNIVPTSSDVTSLVQEALAQPSGQYADGGKVQATYHDPLDSPNEDYEPRHGIMRHDP